VVLLHDNNILIGSTDIDSMHFYEQWMDKTGADQLRLNCCGCWWANHPALHIERDIYQITEGPSHTYFFSVQPGLWRCSSLKQLWSIFTVDYHDSENLQIQQYVKNTFNNYYVWDASCKQIHANSNDWDKYPHSFKTVHVILYGKWFLKCIDVIQDIAKEYNIDLTKRGFYG
jgi:hypothetical protein